MLQRCPGWTLPLPFHSLSPHPQRRCTPWQTRSKGPEFLWPTNFTMCILLTVIAGFLMPPNIIWSSSSFFCFFDGCTDELGSLSDHLSPFSTAMWIVLFLSSFSVLFSSFSTQLFCSVDTSSCFTLSWCRQYSRLRTLFQVATMFLATTFASSTGYSPAASVLLLPVKASWVTHAGHLQTLASWSKPSNRPTNCPGLYHLTFDFVWKLQVLNCATDALVFSMTILISGSCHAEPHFSSPGGFSSVAAGGTLRRFAFSTCSSMTHAAWAAIMVPLSASSCWLSLFVASP